MHAARNHVGLGDLVHVVHTELLAGSKLSTRVALARGKRGASQVIGRLHVGEREVARVLDRYRIGNCITFLEQRACSDVARLSNAQRRV